MFIKLLIMGDLYKLSININVKKIVETATMVYKNCIKYFLHKSEFDSTIHFRKHLCDQLCNIICSI